jgi:hypothetical protein
MAVFRLLISATIAFIFYASWAYYANSLVTNDKQILARAAVVQGTYSAGITLFFTVLLEFFHARFGHSRLCLACIVPRWSKDDVDHPCITKTTVAESLSTIKLACAGNSIPGMLLVPLPALFLQTALVIVINIAFATPNLWLTVAPSIVFSAVYGYSYSIGLTKGQTRSKVTNS